MAALLTALAGLPLLHVSPPAAGGDPAAWPGWRGAAWDDAGTLPDGLAEGPLALRVAWRRDVGSGYAGIAVAGGRAVTLASAGGEDRVVALDAGDGADLWSASLGATYPGRDGAADGPVSTPAIADGRVFALGPWGELRALDAATGETLWSVQLERDLGAVRPHWGFSTSPLVAGGLVHVLTGGGPGRAFTALDARTGEVVWRAGEGVVEYQSPILAELGGRTQLVGATGSTAYGLVPETGEVLWSYEHGGEAFYARILNPTWLPGDRLLWKHRSGLSSLVEVVRDDGGGFSVEHVWNTRHLQRNYNLVVHHDGLLFGHAGDFLSCVDAATGERLWRSREPGNGWVIRAGERLCVLTKAGSLHLAPASREGYAEEARLELFEHATWTPPSLAGGRVYARDSWSDVACVELVPAAPAEASGAEPAGLAAEDAALLAALRDGAPLPLVEDGGRVRFALETGATDVGLACDLLPAGHELPMRRIAGTGVFTATLEAETDARFTYSFTEDFDTRRPDPRNPLRDRTLEGREVSRVEMPRAAALPPAPAAPLAGRLVEQRFEARERDAGGNNPWTGSRDLRVYLPPGYDEGDERYPVLYLSYGSELALLLEAPRVLDELFAEGLPPLVAVLVDTTSPYEYARSHREAYDALLTEELVPWVDAHYRTLPDARHRGLHGVEEAGFAALWIAARHPDVFGLVGVQSLWTVSPRDTDELARTLASAPELPGRVYLDWGLYDLRSPEHGTSTAAASRRVAELLRRPGVELTLRPTNDGGFAGVWRERLAGLVRALYGPG